MPVAQCCVTHPSTNCERFGNSPLKTWAATRATFLSVSCAEPISNHHPTTNRYYSFFVGILPPHDRTTTSNHNYCHHYHSNYYYPYYFYYCHWYCCYSSRLFPGNLLATSSLTTSSLTTFFPDNFFPDRYCPTVWEATPEANVCRPPRPA